MTTQAALWTATGTSVLVAIVAALAERRRTRRRNLDRPGWVPWQPIQFLALLAALIGAALAVRL